MSSFLKNLKTAKDTTLSGILDNYFAANDFPDSIPLEINPSKESDDAFHPSSDSVGCARQIYERRQGGSAYAKPGAELNRTFQIGHLCHAWIQYIVCHELELCDESAIEREYRGTLCGQVADNSLDWRTDPVIQNSIGWMRGHADIVPVEIPGKGPILVDIKTARSEVFNKVPEDNATWEKYHAQCQLYMDWHDVDTAVVLYLNKNDSKFKERIVRRDGDFVDAIYARWIAVAEAERAGVTPECSEGCCGTRP